MLGGTYAQIALVNSFHHKCNVYICTLDEAHPLIVTFH